MKALRSLCNRRMQAVLLTSFASGLPIALTGSTLQAWYTEAHVNLMTIGLLSLVGLPYLLKVLWAPLMERYVPFKGGKRAVWIILWQLCMVLCLLVMSCLSPTISPHLMAVVALMVAFASASQDVVVDAYRTDISQSNERGFAAALLSVGYRFAMLVSGAFALVIASAMGWMIAYRLMALCMLLNVVVSCFLPRVPQELSRPASLREAIIEPMADFLRRDQVLLLLAFIVLYKIADALALALNTTFLLRGVGFDLVTVGLWSKTIGLAATLIGGVVGGVLYPWLGLYRSLLVFGFLQMSSNLLFAALAVVGKSHVLLIISIFGDYFCGGVATTAFVAFLMSLCHQRYSATQYALFSAIASIGRIVCGPLAASMVSAMGWVEFFIMSFLIGLPSLWLLVLLKRRDYFVTNTLAITA
ncbi:MAG: MFS transporter [Legionellales bacterium]|nr:MFS transporter [Legionellales bacterium]